MMFVLRNHQTYSSGLVYVYLQCYLYEQLFFPIWCLFDILYVLHICIGFYSRFGSIRTRKNLWNAPFFDSNCIPIGIQLSVSGREMYLVSTL